MTVATTGRRQRRRPTWCSSRWGASRRRTTSASSSSASSPGKTIHVDAHMRVPGHEWLYAIGDINGRALFTHMGKYQARISADYLLGHDRVLSHGADGPLSPRVIFTEPQVAAVGHTTESAEKAGIDLRRLRDARPRATRAARSTAATRPGRRAGSSTASGGSSSAARSRAPRSPTSCMRRRSRSWARCRSSGCGTRSRLPHAQRDLAAARALKKGTRREPLEVPSRARRKRRSRWGGGPFTSSLALCVSDLRV